MPKQVADKYYITHTIAPGAGVEYPLSSLADNQCPTFRQLMLTKHNGYPINIKPDFYGDPIIDSNGHSSTPVMPYKPERLVSKEDITNSTKTRVDIEIIIQLLATGGVVGYAAAGGKSVYFNDSIYWMAVDKDDIDTYEELPCDIQLGQISVVIKGTGNLSIVQNTSSATLLSSGAYDGSLELYLNNPYPVSFPFPVTSNSDITLANVLTPSPMSYSTSTHEYFFTVRCLTVKNSSPLE